MAKMRATRELQYAGKTILPGQEFDCSDKDARLLKILKKIEDAPPAAKPGVEKMPRPRAVPPLVPDQPESAGDPEPRYYRRRDLRASE